MNNHSTPSDNSCGIVHECQDCGLFSLLPESADGTDLHCPRCGNVLRRVQHHSLDPSFGCGIAALFFYVIALASPMIQVMLYGRGREGSLSTGPLSLDDLGFWFLATVVLLTTIVMPLLKLLGTLTVLYKVRSSEAVPAWVARLYGLLQHISPWAMIEVYLLGFLVAYTRIEQIAHVQLGLAALSLVGLMLSMVTMDAGIDSERVWEKMKKRGAVRLAAVTAGLVGCDTCYQVSHAEPGQLCPRCGEVLHVRKPNSISRTWALTIASAILYIPSNIFPVMNVTRLGRVQSYTIFGGIRELAHIGLMPLAILVFTASIAIPVFKLLALGYMLCETQRHSSAQLCNRTRLYRVIDFIGRWSMVDIFMVSILVAVIRFGWFAQITPDMGAVYFAAVVILTMLAVMSFDPRIMWDVARKQRRRSPLAFLRRRVQA